MEFAIGFLIGALAGIVLTVVASLLRRHVAERQLRETFAALAGQALETSGRHLTEQAATVLEGKRALIEQSVQAINQRLEQVRTYLQQVEADRKKDFGALGSSVMALSATTGELHKMLASTQRRGAWGERMADDILRLAGLQEGVNYTKQSGLDAESGRPDFTFFMPNGLKANMDVKFPLERYKAYLDAETDSARQAELARLVAAVRNHVRTVAGRGYIDPKAPTVDYVILFIPSEQIYSLVLSAAADLIDEALEKKIVLASPLTLYAMLVVIRQSAENFNLMQTADEVVSLLGTVNKQWQRYKEQMDKVGKGIQDARKAYDELVGTRTRMLDQPLEKIDQLRMARGLPEGK